ncbi:ubiquitin carboxyl-terminal hydrolase CYLD [Corythoichthys intestinalis]|uniref:ubiquitin carboxyl-terminal hydrolase CYLD n=1 Tax=Corythoichthys intestinalis TaxID=161448 RepID=UPI0025A56565|nr:ubiquitin carboxyl-terminal hydrolase CYLD [Corythoichthys intestinalis]
MLGAQDPRKKGRSIIFLITIQRNVEIPLKNTIVLPRGSMCSWRHGYGYGHSSEFLTVKTREHSIFLEFDRKFLREVPPECVGLLEAVEPEARLEQLSNPEKLRELAYSTPGTPLWVQMGKKEGLAKAELKYIGPLTPGSRSKYFGVELKGSAAGKGHSTGLFPCPEDCAGFFPVSHVQLRHWTDNNEPDGRDKERDRPHRRSVVHQHRNARPPHAQAPGGGGHHVHLPQTALSAQSLGGLTELATTGTSLLPFTVGQRVSASLDDGSAASGEVVFCGPLPRTSSSSVHVGVLLDTPMGDWDGYHKGEQLVEIPMNYGKLLPVVKVSPESRSHANWPPQVLKPMAKSLPPAAKEAPVFLPASKDALLAPGKKTDKPALPSPPPKPVPNPLPPSPPPKPNDLTVAQLPNGTRPVSPESDRATDEDKALEVGSLVEVNDPPLYGVIRWIGHVDGISQAVAGIELEEKVSAGTDGTYLGERHFRCPPNKGLFVKLCKCRRDSRFPAPETPVNQVARCNSIAFAEWTSERVEENTLHAEGDAAKQLYEGWKKGIQGHLNSCYLDATLFSLFSCCSSADCVLFQPGDKVASEAQDLLRCEIVNPLRRYGYVCASKTMALRRLLEAAYGDASFTNQEKDPEEFLNKLFLLLHVEPLLKIRSLHQEPQECYLYQLFPPHVAPLTSPSSSPLTPSPLPMRVASVQTLLESSFLHAGLKLTEAPSCLLLLMPRFGKEFKMFDAILPTLSLDITDLLDESLRHCSICQALACWECADCYEDQDITPGRLKQYCSICNGQVHSHRKRTKHSPREIATPEKTWDVPLNYTREIMPLFAVTCIETSHYVSFVKHGPEASDWLFFDSMADREGGENGFNVPQVRPCPEVGRYLSMSVEELSWIDAVSFPEPARRLLCDAHMCLYHNPDYSLYK